MLFKLALVDPQGTPCNHTILKGPKKSGKNRQKMSISTNLSFELSITLRINSSC